MTTTHQTLPVATYLYPGQLQNGVYFEAVTDCRFMALHLPDVEPVGELAQMDLYLKGQQVAALLFHPMPGLLGLPFALIVGDELYCAHLSDSGLVSGLVLQPGQARIVADKPARSRD